MKKQIEKLHFLCHSRQLHIRSKCVSFPGLVRRAPTEAMLYIIEFNRAARDWLDDGWLWMKNDCKAALVRTASLSRVIKGGHWPVKCPGFLKQPSFYASALLVAVLLAATFCIDQKHTVYATVYPEKEVLGSAQNGGRSVAWLNAEDGLAQKPAIVNTITETGVTCKLQVTEDVVNVRSGPGQNEPQIGRVQYGDILQAKTKSGDNWYQIDFGGGKGWIAGWLVQVYQPGTRTNPVKIAGRDSPETMDVSRGASSDVISIARRYLGRPYVYGANGPSSFDCSGFVRYVYARCGVDLPRVASDQAQAGKRVSSPVPGDLVFFSDRRNGYITHVGIYLGNNSFINANHGGVTVTSLDDPWYGTRYVMACRVR